MFNPIIRGWLQYYGRYYRSALYPPMRQLDRALARWAERKYKKLRGHLRRATHWVARISSTRSEDVGALADGRAAWLHGGSRMSREVQVRFCESLGVRFPGATHLVIAIDGHHSKRGWANRAQQRLQEQLTPLGVELNKEKTKVVDILKGEAFGFLGFDLRRVRRQRGDGYFPPDDSERRPAQNDQGEDTRHHSERRGNPDAEDGEAVSMPSLAGWVNYFRVGHLSRAFSEVRDYTGDEGPKPTYATQAAAKVEYLMAPME